MNYYDFTLKFALLHNESREELEEKLFGAGCDDALIGIGTAGRVALDFTREADSASDAVSSAIRDVMRAIPNAKLIEVTPDQVGFTEIADILGCTRQNVRNIVLGSLSSPLPFHEGNPTLWHLADMLGWFEETRQYNVEEGMLDLARYNKTINICYNYQKIDPDIKQQVEQVECIVA